MFESRANEGLDVNPATGNVTPAVLYGAGSVKLRGNMLKGGLFTKDRALPDSDLCLDEQGKLHVFSPAAQGAPSGEFEACNKRIEKYRMPPVVRSLEEQKMVVQKRLDAAEAERIRNDPVLTRNLNQKSYWDKTPPPCLETGVNKCERTIKVQYCWKIKPEDRKDWGAQATSCEHGWIDTGALEPDQSFDIRSPFVNNTSRPMDAPEFTVNFACVLDEKLKSCLTGK